MENYTVRIPTRQIQIRNFSLEESEKLFDICTRKRILHVCIDNNIYMNKILHTANVMRMRHEQIVKRVFVIHNESIRNLCPEDLLNDSLIESMKNCFLMTLPDSHESHIVIDCRTDKRKIFHPPLI
jgi:hypothetical protein